MVSGPGLYSDIGKKARDLLYKDYLTAQKFTITTYTPDSVAITSSATKKNDLISGEVSTQIRNKGVVTDVKVNSDSSLSGTFTFDQLTPGLKLSMNVVVPESKNGKLDLQYLHESFGFNSSVGLNVSPVINFAGAVGTSTFAIGADVGLDTATGLVTKYNAGVSYKSSDFAASVNLNNKGDTLVASYYHLVNPRTAVGAELIHGISSNDNTLTFGSQHSLDHFTTVKARLDNFGKASALIQHEWRPKSLITLSSEVDTKSIEKSTKFGLALALKP